VADQDVRTGGRFDGNPAPEALSETVYAQLRALAQSLMSREASGHTLSATAVVHEAYLRLSEQDRTQLVSESHYLSLAATMMRRVLVDHARARKTQKRHADGARLTLSEVEGDALLGDSAAQDVADLDSALNSLTELEPRAARVVELRYFAGLTVERVAEVMDVSERTVKGDWNFARAWLRDRLKRMEA